MSNSADDAVIKVRLDTKDAHADMRALMKAGEGASVNVGRNWSNSLGGAGFGLGKLAGMGAAIGGAFAIGQPLLGPTLGTIGGMTNEALGPWGKKFEQFLFGKTGAESRSSQFAREQAIATFGVVAGAKGEIPAGAANWFNQVKALRMNEEKGRDLFESDTKFFGPGVDTLIDRLVKGIGEKFTEAVNAIGAFLNPTKWL